MVLYKSFHKVVRIFFWAQSCCYSWLSTRNIEESLPGEIQCLFSIKINPRVPQICLCFLETNKMHRINCRIVMVPMVCTVLCNGGRLSLHPCDYEPRYLNYFFSFSFSLSEDWLESRLQLLIISISWMSLVIILNLQFRTSSLATDWSPKNISTILLTVWDNFRPMHKMNG